MHDAPHQSLLIQERRWYRRSDLPITLMASLKRYAISDDQYLQRGWFVLIETQCGARGRRGESTSHRLTRGNGNRMRSGVGPKALHSSNTGSCVRPHYVQWMHRPGLGFCALYSTSTGFQLVAPAEPLSRASIFAISSADISKSYTSALDTTRAGRDDFGSGLNLWQTSDVSTVVHTLDARAPYPCSTTTERGLARRPSYTCAPSPVRQGRRTGHAQAGNTPARICRARGSTRRSAFAGRTGAPRSG